MTNPAMYEVAKRVVEAWLDRQEEIEDLVDALWPVAIAEGRRQAAEAIRTAGREVYEATGLETFMWPEEAALIAEGSHDAPVVVQGVKNERSWNRLAFVVWDIPHECFRAVCYICDWRGSDAETHAAAEPELAVHVATTDHLERMSP